MIDAPCSSIPVPDMEHQEKVDATVSIRYLVYDSCIEQSANQDFKKLLLHPELLRLISSQQAKAKAEHPSRSSSDAMYKKLLHDSLLSQSGVGSYTFT